MSRSCQINIKRFGLPRRKLRANMTERLDPSRLTKQSLNLRLELGRNFMTDGTKSPEQPNPQEVERNPSEAALKLKDSILAKGKITPEKIESAKIAWEEENKIARGTGRPLSTDLATQRIYIESGVLPHRTPEYARKEYEEIAIREGRGLTDVEKESIEAGIPPMSGGAVGPFPSPPPPSVAAINAIINRVESPLDLPRITELVGYDSKARDEYFNNIFEIVDSSLHEFFQQAFGFQSSQRYETFMTIILNASREPQIDPILRVTLEADYERYQVQRRLVEGIHNVNAILYIPSIKPEQIYEHFQSIESLIGDAAHRVLGVVEMANILERALREEMRKNEGYLRPEAITGTVKPQNVQKLDAAGNPVLDAAGNPVYDNVLIKIAEGDVERRVKELFKRYVTRAPANHGLYTRKED